MLVGVESPRRYTHLLLLPACEVLGAATVSLTLGPRHDITLERMIGGAIPPPPGHPPHVQLFGAAVAPGPRRLVRERLHATVENTYASNEMNLVAMMYDDSVGTLCPGVEIRIVDESGRDKATGETGLIRVKSDAMAHEYFNDPELTAATFIDGWFQTSDIGVMPEPGRLAVLGRVDDMLNIGGVKVPPAPIEAQLKMIEGVRDAVVMSILSPNEVGSLLVAIEIDLDPIPADVERQIGAIVARYVGVFSIMPLRMFPRTESGKARRPVIEAAFRRRQTARS
jgi:acyl-coenzyme A synthetase/AMP-(fatty) acid ligase